jgi:hypothetical protein
MNIAVSFVDGRISLVRCVNFEFAQFAGAVVGGLIVYSIVGTIGVTVSKLFPMPVDGCSINPTVPLCDCGCTDYKTWELFKSGLHVMACSVGCVYLFPIHSNHLVFTDLLLLRKKPSSWEDTLHRIEKDIESLEYSISVYTY